MKNVGNVDENIPSEKKSTHIHIPFIWKNECVVLETESNLVGYFVSYFVLISNSICLMFTARLAVSEEPFTMHTLSLICKDWICYFSYYTLFFDSKPTSLKNYIQNYETTLDFSPGFLVIQSLIPGLEWYISNVLNTSVL